MFSSNGYRYTFSWLFRSGHYSLINPSNLLDLSLKYRRRHLPSRRLLKSKYATCFGNLPGVLGLIMTLQVKFRLTWCALWTWRALSLGRRCGCRWMWQCKYRYDLRVVYDINRSTVQETKKNVGGSTNTSSHSSDSTLIILLSLFLPT